MVIFENETGQNQRQACPICQSDSRPAKSIGGHQLLSCVSCRHWFLQTNPSLPAAEDIFQDQYFSDGGGGYSGYALEAPLRRRRGRGYARILRRLVTTGTMIDVGCASGHTLQGFIDEGWTGVGVEINENMAAAARREFGLEVFQGRFSDYAADRPVDLITLIQVVAHLKQPHVWAQKAYDSLKPGGLCLIETWDRESLTAKLFQGFWHQYDPPVVEHWFNRRSLRQVLEAVGLEFATAGRYPKAITANHAQSLINGKLGDTAITAALSQVLAFLKDTATISYPFDDLYWCLFRRPS